MSYYFFNGNSDADTEDIHFMKLALEEAKNAAKLDEVPIGAIIVCNGKIIGRGYNLTEKLNDVTAHAEMQAFTSAFETLGGKYLNNCTLYVTIEPCVMCAGASYWTQISRIVFGAREEKRGFLRLKENILHPKTLLKGGVLESECAGLMKEFFLSKRK